MTTKCNSAFNLARQPGHVVSSPTSMARHDKTVVFEDDLHDQGLGSGFRRAARTGLVAARRNQRYGESGSAALLGSAQPRELRIQSRDRRSGALRRGKEGGDPLLRSVGLTAQAVAPIACLGLSAARSDAPQLFGRLVKQQIGRRVHGIVSHDHSSRQWGREASQMWKRCASLFGVFSNTCSQSGSSMAHVRRRR
jgi:hypothetical protein